MSANTSIEWCDHTFNPWWGCAKISPGCDHCYAAEIDRRFHGGRHWEHGSYRTFGEAHWDEPRRWNASAKRKGRVATVFCASMGDVFDSKAPASERERLWDVIAATPSLTWLLLTKRPQNMDVRYLPAIHLDNVRLGYSAENQREYDRRIHAFSSMPDFVFGTWFVSVEPMLGPVSLLGNKVPSVLGGYVQWLADIIGCDLRALLPSWVICGGESGQSARPMEANWVRDLRDECRDLGVPFFFKQWGRLSNNPAGVLDGHGKGGALLDGRLWRDRPFG